MAERAALLALEDALAQLVTRALQNPITVVEEVSTFDALGRLLADDVVSLLDVPPADNTSMDGYAVRAADIACCGTVLPVSQRVPAGAVGAALAAGTAARVFTGAQVPPGADAVVMQEQCEAVAGAGLCQGSTAGWSGAPQRAPQPGLGFVRFSTVPQPGQWIRRRGEDVCCGSTVLRRGTRLTPQALGLAASVGAGRLAVVRRPRVALFSTGDELVMPGQVAPAAMPPGAIYNSNRYTLRALLQAAGCEVSDLGIVPDRLEATRAALREAAAAHDLILTSGGVSVGEEDHLKPAVQAEGRLALWQIAIKPGKPLAFGEVRRSSGLPSDPGSVRDTALFIGLPGNPVASFVTFLLVVAPVLRALQGAEPGLRSADGAAVGGLGLPLRADFDWPRPDRRREFLRVRVNPAGGLDLFPNQSSGVLTSAVWADGLLDNPPGQVIGRGQTVRFLPLQALIHG